MNAAKITLLNAKKIRKVAKYARFSAFVAKLPHFFFVYLKSPIFDYFV